MKSIQRPTSNVQHPVKKATGTHSMFDAGSSWLAVLQRRVIISTAVALMAITSGCAFLKPAKSESHYYVLTAGQSQSPTHHSESRKGAVVRLAPVEVANYLQNKEMAVREETNEISFDLNHQWAEPLEAGIRRVLAEDLRKAPGIRDLVTYEPAPSSKTVYTVSVHVLACEGSRAKHPGSAVFKAAWQITCSGARQRVLAHGVFEAPQTAWHPGHYGRLANQLSRALDDFSRMLAGAISRQTKSQSST